MTYLTRTSFSHALTMGLVATLLMGVGCSTPTRNPVPMEKADLAIVPEMPAVRAWAGRLSPAFQDSIVESFKVEKPGDNPVDADGAIHYSLLALSGGGPDGAYGAGILNGWSARGNRPKFKLVTGVSAGALLATFAFLGEEYDPVIKKFFTETKTEDVIKEKSLLALMNDDSLTDTTPLATILAEQVTAEVLAKVAAEHAKGRRLFVGTTNLDSDKFVIWDMGAIASSKSPGALALYRKVLLASASIPVAMPPQYIEVDVDGKRYDEMHVDGGSKFQVFLYGVTMDIPAAMRAAKLADNSRKADLYIIRNSKFTAGNVPVNRTVMSIAGKAVSSIIAGGSIGDMYRIYSLTSRGHAKFHLGAIPPDFNPTVESESLFDPKAMREVYKLGYDQASSKNGYPWQNRPPGMREVDARK